MNNRWILLLIHQTKFLPNNLHQRDRHMCHTFNYHCVLLEPYSNEIIIDKLRFLPQTTSSFNFSDTNFIFFFLVHPTLFPTCQSHCKPPTILRIFVETKAEEGNRFATVAVVAPPPPPERNRTIYRLGVILPN